MTTKTLRDIQAFAQNASAWLSLHPERTKFSYALGRVIKRLEPHLATFNEQLEDINIDHAVVDEKGSLVIENDRYSFDRAGMQAKTVKVRALLLGTVEFEPYYAPADFDSLSEIEVMAFEGFVIPETDGEQPIIMHEDGTPLIRDNDVA